MKFDSYITSGTKTAFTVKINTKKSIFDKFYLEKAAFTLAETLITLTIIGVIAALTIPNLISSYQKHTYVVGLKKAYSQLQNAMSAGWNESGHLDENGQWVSDVTNIDGQEFNGTRENKRLYLLSKQFKINKLCYNKYSTDESCEKLLRHFHDYGNIASFITNDGMIFTSYADVDINGFKGPNKYGRDQFYLDITNEDEESRYNIPQGTVVPWGSKLYADIHGEEYYWRNNNNCTTENVNKTDSDPTFGHHQYIKTQQCTGRVLEEDAMNY